MKYSLFTLSIILFVNVNAQFPYTLEVISSEYQEIDGEDYLNAGWNDPEFSAQIGFDFQFDNYLVSELTQYGSGCVMYTSTWPTSNGFTPVPYDLIDKTILGQGDTSLVSWGATGDLGTQVFTMEWRNCGISSDINSPTASNVNFQIKLYEETGVIEYHFGEIEVQSASPFWSTLGLNFNYTTQEGDFTLVSGSLMDPYLTFYNSIQEMYTGESLDEIPSLGTVFRFTPTNLSVFDQESQDVKIFPNPSNGYLTVQFEIPTNWSVYDLTGSVVFSGNHSNSFEINLESGLYFLNSGEHQTYPIVVL